MGLLEAGAQADTFAPVLLQAVRNSFVVPPRDWGTMAGLHFWVTFADKDMFDATKESNLENWGWVKGGTVTIVNSANSGDFLDDVNLDPTYALLSTSGDLIKSPDVFGGFEHSSFLKAFLGFEPSRLILETFAQFTNTPGVNSQSIGLHDENFSASFTHDGTDFQINDGTSSVDVQTGDNNWHIFKMRVEKGDNVYGSIDGGTEVPTGNSPDNIWPVPFKAEASTNDHDLRISWVHIWYE